MRVVVVGPCASGKTTLVAALRQQGFDAYNIAQEHSGIRRLWEKRQPDVVIMLDVTMTAVHKRREVYWGEERLLLQRERLKEARSNAHLYIQTDRLQMEDVLTIAVTYLKGAEFYLKHNSDGAST